MKILQNKDRYFVNSNSLIYAIFISAIVAILIANFIILSSLYINLERKIDNHLETISFYNNTYQLLIKDKNGESFQDYFKDKNKEFKVEVKEWGFLKVKNLTLFSRIDTINKSYFVAKSHPLNSNIAIYEANFNKTLNLAGISSIKGDIYTSDRGYSSLTINNIVHSGNCEIVQKKISAKTLPLRAENFVMPKNCDNYDYSYLQSKNINSFKKNTIRISNVRNVSNIEIIGNYILHSSDSIYISKTAILEDVIIDAPIVYFEDDFKGILQVISKEKIVIGNNVDLLYPSTLYIESNTNKDANISVGSNSIFYGLIVLDGKESYFDKYRNFTIEDNGLVLGDVYCKGTIDNRGKIYGTVYVNNFSYITSTTSYDNTVFNGIFDVFKRPNNFIKIDIEDEKSNTSIIKEVW